MSVDVSYVPMAGGLDLNTTTYNVAPGRLLGMQNFEKVYGRQGYRRIDGYERFDGKAKPSDAPMWMLEFESGGVAPALGAKIINGAMGVGGPSRVAVVIAISVVSGSWMAGTAAGFLTLTSDLDDRVETAWTGNNIMPHPSGATRYAVAASDLVIVTPSDPLFYESRFLATEYRRDLIDGVPGAGPVLGLCVFKKTLYAFRGDDALPEYGAQNGACTMYKSTSSGWTEVRGLIPYVSGEKFKFSVSTFTGSSNDQAMYIVNGTMRMLKYDGATFTEVDNIYGSESLSTSTNTINSAAPADKTFTVTTGRSWTVGDLLRVVNRTNGKMLAGEVKAYSGTSLVMWHFEEPDYAAPPDLYTPDPFLETGSDWDIFKDDRSDRPFDLVSHKNHMFLAYGFGQLQTSNLGDPMVCTTSAAAFGLGAEITGFLSLKGSTLAVFCDSQISLLSGSSVTDWKLDVHSTNAGARPGSLQENVGDAIFLDDRGLTTLSATDAFGSFAPAVFSRDVASLLGAYYGRINASALAKTKYQYRMYMDDGLVLVAALNANGAAINADNTEFTVCRYPEPVTCFAVGDMSDGSDMMFFGSQDGYVMQEDVGVSFDGAVIDSTLRLHFNHFKSPSQKKRFRKLVLEVDASTSIAVNFKQSFDVEDGTYRPTGNQSINAIGTDSGVWSDSAWDLFRWSSPTATHAVAHIDGYGLNMNLLLWHSSAVDESFTVQGLLIHHSKMGLAR